MTIRRLALVALSFCALISPSRAAVSAGLGPAILAYRHRDFKTGLALATPLADAGSADAQMLVGMMNLIGVEGGLADGGDKVVSAKYLKMAADRNEAEAQCAYASLLRTASTASDELVAAETARGAKLGSPICEYYHAVNLLSGKGIRRDEAQAKVWLTRSVDAGYAGGQHYLGLILTQGHLAAFPNDPVEGAKDLILAARAPVRDAVNSPLSLSGVWTAKMAAMARTDADAWKAKLTPPQLAEAARRADASAWKPLSAR